MNLLLHHFRKDFRHSRWWMLLTLSVTAGILWFPTVPLEERAEQMKWLSLFRYGGWLLLFLTAGRLVQLDLPIRDTAFFRTRPVPLSTLLLSKSLTVLALIIPMALMECLMLLLIGLKPAATDLLLIFTEEMLVLSVISGVTMAVAASKESAGKYHSSVMVWAATLMVGWIVCANQDSWLFRNEKPEWSYTLEYLKISRLLTIQFIGAAGSLIGLVLFVRSRRHETTNRSLLLTGLSATAAWFFWPVNFVKAFAPSEAAAPVYEWPDPTKLEFSFREQQVGPNRKSMFTFSDGGYNDTTYRRVRAFSQLKGLPAGWYAYPNGYESELSLSDHRVVPSRYESWAGLSETIILPRVGITSPYQNNNSLSEVDLAEFRLPDAADAMTGAKIKGTIHVPLKRPVILARVPFRKGVSARVGNRHFRITQVEQNNHKISYNLVTETTRVQLRGGWISEPHRRVETLVINAAKHEYLQSGNSSSSGDSTGHYSLQNQRFSKSVISRDPMKKWDAGLVPEDWLDGAELLIIGNEYGGTFSYAFDFSDINLSNER